LSDILTVLGDLSNVVLFQGLKIGRMDYYIQMRTLIEDTLPGSPIYFIADARTRHRVDNKELFEEACSRGEIVQTPAGESADYYIIEYARTKGNCIIISRDGYKDNPHSKAIAGILVPFTIIGDAIILSPKIASFRGLSLEPKRPVSVVRNTIESKGVKAR
jgi:hypothetical protein